MGVSVIDSNKKIVVWWGGGGGGLLPINVATRTFLSETRTFTYITNTK